jgi:hypothetical protein
MATSETTSTKRTFYNTGAAKGFGKIDYFLTVKALIEGEDVGEEKLNLVLGATEHEIEGISLRSEKTASAKDPNAPKKDRNDSAYAQEIRAALVPLLSPSVKQTAAQLSAAAAKAGKVGQKSGKPYPIQWIGGALKKEPKVKFETAIVEVVGKDGLKSQKPLEVFYI